MIYLITSFIRMQGAAFLVLGQSDPGKILLYKLGKAPLSLALGFKYNPIDDARFAILEGTADELTDGEKRAIDLVVNTFGIYGGKTLEAITHNEDPWKDARKGCEGNIPSSEIITKEKIRHYYETVNQEYGLDTEEGITHYIQNMLKNASCSREGFCQSEKR